VSSKRRRALYRVPVPNSSDTEWGRYSARSVKSLDGTSPPWIVERNWRDDITPLLSGLERGLVATEKLMARGDGSDTLSEFNRTLTRIVTAWRAVAEMPKNANKHYPELQDLSVQYRRDEATFLTAEPITGRLWIMEILYPPYSGLSPRHNEQTGKWSYIEADFVETYYYHAIKLSKMLGKQTRE
jgi:hypothetical protein